MSDQQVIDQFETAVSQLMAGGVMSRHNAVTVVKRKNPRLAQAYVIATNPGMRQKRELTERFETINALTK